MLTEDLARGVVSMPHGFSEYANGRQSVASARPGVNSNAIAPADHVDAISATVALNGIPVAVKLERFVC